MISSFPCSKSHKQSLDTSHHINNPASSVHAPSASAQQMLMAYTHNAFGSYGKVHGLYAQHEGDEGWQEGSDLKGEEGGPPCLRGP